jgi:hypothetical protein
MIRKLNASGRKKIPYSDARIRLHWDRDGRRFFDLHLQLDDLVLPANARVYVEAYHRAGFRRYDFGTVSNIDVAADRSLVGIIESATPIFRVKVVDQTDYPGRILASVDKIRPDIEDPLPADGQLLLLVEYDDLGSAIWQVDLDGDWPVLKLNHTVDEIRRGDGLDNRFLSLVVPEVLRQILYRILIEDDHTDPACDDDWPSLWLKFASTLPGMSVPHQLSKAGRQAWVEKAVAAFCADSGLLDKFLQASR